jgi:ribosome-binding ATPase YchF (GTP1/OBG family)
MGSVDPQRDIAAMESKNLLNDLIQVERKLERLEEEIKRKSRDKADVNHEKMLFERLMVELSENIPLRDVELGSDETKTIAGYGFLSLKDLLIVFNLGEGQEAPEINYPCQVCVVSMQGQLEMEIAQLPQKMWHYLWLNMISLNRV